MPSLVYYQCNMTHDSAHHSPDALDLPVLAQMLQTPGLVPAPVTVPVSVTPAPGVHTGPVTTGEVAPATLAPALGLVTPVTAVTTSVTQPRLVNTLEAILIVSIDIVSNEIVIKSIVLYVLCILYLTRYLRDTVTLDWVSVGPVERLAGVDAAYLVSPVIAVRHSVTSEAELDAEAVIAAELVSLAHRGTVSLVILAVLDPVTPGAGSS